MVESAIARPYSGYYRPIARKAAALMESVATNHGFADGNKRTSVILMHLLLSKSGYRLAPLECPTIDHEIEQAVMGVVRHEMSFDDLVEWFKRRISKA